MITWLQQSVFKHQRFLFGALLFVIVIAFVLMSGSGGGFLGSDNKSRRINFFGYEMSNPRIRTPLEHHAYLSQMLNFRQSSAIDRAAQLSLCDTLGVAEPNEEQLKAHIAKLPGLQNNGTADKARLTMLIDRAKTTLGLTEEAAQKALQNTLAEDWRMARLAEILGAPNFLLPSEALARAKEQKTVRSVDVAELTFTAYSASNKVEEPSAKILEEYYKTRSAAYAIPAKPRHVAVVFEGEKLVTALAQPLTEPEIQAYFESHKSRYEVKVTPPMVAVVPTLENSREKVVYDLTSEKLTAARDEASQVAAETFLEAISQEKGYHKSSNFKTLVEKSAGRLVTLPALSSEDSALPAPLIAAEFQRMAPLVTELEPYSTKPMKVNGGYGALFFEGTEPGRETKLEEVKGKVIAEWKENESRTAWDKAVNSARDEIVKAVAAGTSFKEAAEKLAFKVTPVEDFTVSNVPVPSLRSFLVSENFGSSPRVSPLVSKLKQGEVSPNSGGSIVFLRKLSEPALTPASPEVAAVLVSESEELSRSSFQSTIQELIKHEMERINPKEATPPPTSATP